MPADLEAVKALARTVDGLPLALELLGGYLAVPENSLLPQLSQAAVAEMMDPRRRLQLAQERLGGSGEEETLQETIMLSIEGLRELENGAELERAFYALGAFAPKPEQFSWQAAAEVTGLEMKISSLISCEKLGGSHRRSFGSTSSIGSCCGNQTGRCGSLPTIVIIIWIW